MYGRQGQQQTREYNGGGQEAKTEKEERQMRLLVRGELSRRDIDGGSINSDSSRKVLFFFTSKQECVSSALRRFSGVGITISYLTTP